MASPLAPMKRERRIDMSSLVTGVAFGAVITVLAMIAVVPEANGGDGVDASTLSPVVLPEGYGPGDALDPDGLTTGEGGPTSRGLTPGGSGPTSRGLTGAASGDQDAGSSIGGGIDVSAGFGGQGPGGDSKQGNGGGGGGCSGAKPKGVPGVSDSEIKLGATVVEDGFASAFLGEVPQALRAVEKKVNRQGGICGRQLKILTKNDNWDAQRGKTNIENLIEEDVFAFAVSPSSEGLNAASKAGVFARSKVPVVGADGLNNTQFQDPYIWPVAAATTTTVHVIMKNAWDRCEALAACGTLKPAIVFGNSYRFGVEGAFAFNAAYKELSDENIPGYSAGETGCKTGSRYCGISSGQDTYTGPVSIVNQSCGGSDPCNFLLVLLEPDTALKFLKTAGAPTAAKFKVGMAGAQPLFTANFADGCDEPCKDMWVWTGYNPPIEQFAPEQYGATRTYVDDLRAQSGSVDIANQFTEGGYIGMLLLVEALEQVGNNLTRENLVATLNSMAALDTGLSVPLKWTASQRYANHSAQAFKIEVAKGWTGGWAFQQGFVKDPWLGKHTG